jgi:hypothetical protein
MKTIQPVCDPCWVEENSEWEETYDGESVPVSYSIPTVHRGFPLELCCLCGRHTISGIYIKRHPDTVPYPTYVPDET